MAFLKKQNKVGTLSIYYVIFFQKSTFYLVLAYCSLVVSVQIAQQPSYTATIHVICNFFKKMN